MCISTETVVIFADQLLRLSLTPLLSLFCSMAAHFLALSKSDSFAQGQQDSSAASSLTSNNPNLMMAFDFDEDEEDMVVREDGHGAGNKKSQWRRMLIVNLNYDFKCLFNTFV